MIGLMKNIKTTFDPVRHAKLTLAKARELGIG
jgi:hypothetical protein